MLPIELCSKKGRANHHGVHKIKAHTITLAFLFASTMQGIGSQPSNAQSSRQSHMPLEITVEKVSVTDKDLDQAAKFCLIKEGSLKKGSTINDRPTPAQTIVMATMCP
ncbi:hypothetical protein OAZ06_02965 [Synechococcus sp. AH-736-G20]|nr:hypothetical protein [Synechococcus sp. AH-736-G20]